MSATDNASKQLSGLQTLKEIMKHLERAKMKAESSVSESETSEKEQDQPDRRADVSCCFCKQPISDGSFAVSLICCGACSHLQCLAKVGDPGQKAFPHICPLCKASFDEEQVAICQQLVLILEPSD